tara:strand:+ start:72 stop:320 length:249 start_codon:yes stop_codon:yes gene_type:complete
MNLEGNMSKSINVNRKEEISANIFAAVIKDLEAKESKAIVAIQLYLHNAIGDVIDDITGFAEAGARAQAAKQFLLDKFTQES